MACPDCGSEKAVDKAEAWDAAAAIPAKAEKQMAADRRLRDIAARLVRDGPMPPPDQIALGPESISVNLDMFLALADAIGLVPEHLRR